METLLLMGEDTGSLKRLKGVLVRAGFRVTAVGVSELARMDGALSSERFAVVLLDASGGSLEGLMRQAGPHLKRKELKLMALISQDQLKAVEGASGLEDYLVMPAPSGFLETRVRFLMNRFNQIRPGSGIRIGALEINPDRYEVLLESEPLELTYKEFELFKFLATHPNRVFDRDQLLNQVWGYDFIGGTRTVDVHIRRLRAKLGPKYASLIVTVRHVGYKFVENL